MKRDRDYKLISQTTSLCSTCLRNISAKIIEKNDKIYILKNCSRHGKQVEILEEDPDFYNSRQAYNKPCTISKTQTNIVKGCPFDCGLCPDHEQHTCIGLIEVTPACDLKCPVCYACSGIGKPLSLKKIEEMMNFLQDSEFEEAEILQISGGEPTTHPEILEIIKMAKSKKFKYVMLNTNGLRIANDIEFVKKLSKFKGNFEIYLQFDGFENKAYSHLRGRELLETKKRAIENLSRYEIPITLVATIERGINDNQIGKIIEFGINTKNVRGINLQPLAFFGRLKNHDTKNRITLTGIIKEIEKQTNAMIKKSDFIPLPCNIDRVAVTYLYRSRGEFIPITRNLNVKNYMQILDNTFAFDADRIIKNVKERSCCSLASFFKDFSPMIPKSFIFKSEKNKVKFVDENTFRISVTSFIDKYNFDMTSIKRECVHIITPDMKKIPFSAFNMVHRKKYVENK